MYEEVEKWMKVVGKRKFMGGSVLNFVDLVKILVLIINCNFRYYILYIVWLFVFIYFLFYLVNIYIMDFLFCFF